MNRKLRTVIFWGFLAFGVGLGAPYDPKKTEDIVCIMNEARIEVVLEKAGSPPDFGAMIGNSEAEEQSGAQPEIRGGAKRSRGAGRLKKVAIGVLEWFRRGQNRRRRQVVGDVPTVAETAQKMPRGYGLGGASRMATRKLRITCRAFLIALVCCCAVPALEAQGHSVVCNKGDGQFQIRFSTGVGVYVGPSRQGDLESRSCDATLSWEKKTIAVASGVPEAHIDALGAELGFGQPVAAFEIESADPRGRMTYEIYSLQKAPRLLRKITGGDFYRSADTDMDGRVEIWTSDVAALVGFDGLPLGDFEFAPTVVLRIERGRLLDVSAEFQPEYDKQIAKVRAEFSSKDLSDFKASDGKTPAAPSLSGARLDQLKLTKARVLEIVWAYLYSGRDREAWQALEEMWPAQDVARARSVIEAARARGIRTQVDGTVTDAAKDKSKDAAFVYDTPNSVEESVVSPTLQNARTPETAAAVTKTQANPVSDTTPTAILLHMRVANGEEPTFPAGGAVLDLVIDSAGKVERAQAVGDVDPAVLLASKDWTFIPAFKDGHAVASRMRMAVSLSQ